MGLFPTCRGLCLGSPHAGCHPSGIDHPIPSGITHPGLHTTPHTHTHTHTPALTPWHAGTTSLSLVTCAQSSQLPAEGSCSQEPGPGCSCHHLPASLQAQPHHALLVDPEENRFKTTWILFVPTSQPPQTVPGSADSSPDNTVRALCRHMGDLWHRLTGLPSRPLCPGSPRSPLMPGTPCKQNGMS